MRSLLPLLAASSLTVTLGCQAIAGIDDRSLAPVTDAADTSIGTDSATLDTGSATDSPIEDTFVADTGSEDTMTVLPDTATDSDVATDTADTATTARIVVNEVRASNGDYVEIYNRSAEPVDISGWGVTGTEDTGGFSTPVRFATGTTLAPGAWMLILAGQPTSGGPQTACGGPPSCYHADWGISQSRGETFRILRADDTIEDEYSYPMNGHADGRSWGRVPDGTGTFVVNTPSPGVLNKL